MYRRRVSLSLSLEVRTFRKASERPRPARGSFRETASNRFPNIGDFIFELEALVPSRFVKNEDTCLTVGHTHTQVARRLSVCELRASSVADEQLAAAAIARALHDCAQRADAERRVLETEQTHLTAKFEECSAQDSSLRQAARAAHESVRLAGEQVSGDRASRLFKNSPKVFESA